MVRAFFVDGKKSGHLFHILRVTIRRQAHDLVLIPVMRKTQVLGKSRVEKPNTVWEVLAFQHVEIGALPSGQHGRGEVPRPIDAEYGRLFKRRTKKRRCQMCPMVLNELNLGAHHLGVDPRLHLFETLMQLFDVVFVGTALRPHGPRSPRLFDYESRFAVTLGRWVTANGNGFDLVQRAPSLLQAKLNGLGGKARPMLYAAKSLFFGGHQKLSIHENGC